MSTIIDVAKHCGLSVGTVSNYINGKPIREENEEKISKAISTLGFEVNSLARSFRTKKTNSIGVIVNTLNSIYNMAMLHEIEKCLKENGYFMVVACSDNDVDSEREQIQSLIEKYVDGLIIFPVSLSKSRFDDIISDEIPVVLVDHTINSFNYACVLADNLNASYNATEYLIKNGHSRIGIVSGHTDASTSIERIKGFKRALTDYNILINESIIKTGYYTRESGYEITKELLTMENRPTALFVISFDLLLGVMDAIYDLKVSIPNDLSILTYDYFEYSDFIRPKITSIKQPNELMGIETAKLIINMIKKKIYDYGFMHRCKSELIIKDSVKNIKII